MPASRTRSDRDLRLLAGAVFLSAAGDLLAPITLALQVHAVRGAMSAAQTAWLFLPVALAGYAVGGVGQGAKNALVRTLIQLRVPARAHGRAFAAYAADRP